MKKFLPVFFSILTVLLIIGCNNNYAPFRPTADIVFEPALPENPLRLSVNKTCQIHAKVIYDNATDKNLIYSSADDSIASVDDKGVVTAHKTGDTKITIKASNGVSKEITVSVTTTPIPVTGIELSSGETAISVENGATRQIGAYVVPENATNKNLTYSIDDDSIASVTADGLITAKEVGSTAITITAADGISKTVNLTVTKATVHVTSIEFNPPLPTEPIELFLNEIYKFDIKVFWLNNGGYHSIRQTQKIHFHGETAGYYGIDAKSGLSFPDVEKIAYAYGLKYYLLDSQTNIDKILASVFSTTEPVLCEVVLDTKQEFAPKLTSRILPDGKIISPSLEDMSPFLSEEELKSNMLN